MTIIEQLIPDAATRDLLEARYAILTPESSFEQDLMGWVQSQVNKATAQAEQIGGGASMLKFGAEKKAAHEKRKADREAELKAQEVPTTKKATKAKK